MTPAGFPHSDTPGSTLGCQLPRAYRRLLRPSSALDAKASTMCPSQLVTHTTNPHHPPPPANKRRQGAEETRDAHTKPQRTNKGTHPQSRHAPHNNKTNKQPHTTHPPQQPNKQRNPQENPRETLKEPCLPDCQHAHVRAVTRCSRPLSRSQTTTPHPPPPPTPQQGTREAAAGRELKPQHPDPPQGPLPHKTGGTTGTVQGSDSSEPQQCVVDPTPGSPARPPPITGGQPDQLTQSRTWSFHIHQTAPGATTPCRHSADTR
jgi:hypothetical protein